MTKSKWGIIAVAALSLGALFAQQDITGTWQGTLTLPTKQEVRLVFKISKEDAGMKAVMYSIDQTPQPIAAVLSLTGAAIKITVPAAGITYDGKLDTDGVNLSGNFVQGGSAAIPLNFKKTGPTNPEWPMPDAPATPKAMAADADPEFDACSIKPSDPGQQGRGLTVRGREIVSRNTTASFLMTFVYGVSPRQITGGPAWTESDGFDLDGKPAQEGIANQKQMKIMIQKLLADRFQLKFHREKRELPAYVLQLGKNGTKLTKSAADPKGLPGLGFRALGDMVASNATMADFASTLQLAVLDRPVVDQTGLDGHYDFLLKWTPDETQFTGMGIRVPAPSDKADAPPDLTNAMLDQLGLKLVAGKAPVEVLVIDHIAKPSAN